MPSSNELIGKRQSSSSTPHCEIQTSVTTKKPPSRSCQLRRDATTQRRNDLMLSLQSYGLDEKDGKKLSVLSSMTLEKIHISEDSILPANVVMAFLTRLMSYDYRSMRVFQEIEEPALSNRSDISESRQYSNFEGRISCRDFVHEILAHCDPFLKQEVLSKMSACQLAVPVIMSDVNQGNVVLLLWGLQKISKAWQDQITSEIREANVTQFPFPVVAALRFGNTGCSKSNTLNKMLGSVQGNDEHPYFLSQEQDMASSVLSEGTVEAVWYLPSDGKKGKYTIGHAVCFLNLRGDALKFQKQITFLLGYAMITMVFVNRRDARTISTELEKISRESMLIVILSSNNSSPPKGKRDDYVEDSFKRLGAIVLDTSKLSQIDVCAMACNEINVFLKHSKQPSISLEKTTLLCENSGITIDMSNDECSKARKTAEKILQTCSQSPKQYKLNALPLQVKWQKWSQLDKDRSWKGAQGNVERELARLHKAKSNQRQQQREIGMSKQMLLLYQELSNTSVGYKQFLVFWLQHYLNAISLASLRPLLDKLKKTRDKLRETAANITDLQRRLNSSSLLGRDKLAFEAKVKQLKSKEDELQEDLIQQTNTFDASSLGFEHFVREFGQTYECFHNIESGDHRQRRQPFNAKSLPRMAADMLLSGHPLEIFDGDACHVPIKWVKGVLAAVEKLIGDASVYVISVIGIQSSGKSTLLNSMFGVRFAVSAGRCTRGVFMQLLPISATLRAEIDCEYVVVIDTEGLKAPEKAISDRKSEDNELATFALCLSDMTLINIGGQTVGEDLSNILQISAHAFIRMKEVHLRSSCYLIQQFVADVTAVYRNESSTQSILQTLDQAVITAAAEEGKEDQYRQFSDCFNIVNIDNKKDNVQYIPSLWRGSMSSPNQAYSETVSKLKTALLKGIKNCARPQRLSDFAKRIGSVWDAVKQEDFVFNFRNTVEISQYNTFTQMFKKEQLHLTQTMMKWELEAKQQLRNTSAENIERKKRSLLLELERKLAEEMSRIQIFIDDSLKIREFESVRQHETYFYSDLELVEKNISVTVKRMIFVESEIVSNAKAKEHQILPKLKADLRKQVLPVAERVKEELLAQYTDMSKDDIVQHAAEYVTAQFEEVWSKCMEDIELLHPTITEEQIHSTIESDMYRCVQDSLKNTNLSMGMKQLMNSHKLLGLCEFTPSVQSAKDISQAFRHIGPCVPEITEHYDQLLHYTERVQLDEDFDLSEEFFNGIRDPLRSIISLPCPGCGTKTNLLVTLCCRIVQSSNNAIKHNLLQKMIKNRNLLRKLKQDGRCTKWKIAKQVEQCVRKKVSHVTAAQVFKKLLSWIGWQTDISNENFQNQLRLSLHEIISKAGNPPQWYSEAVTQEFISKVNDMLTKRSATDTERRHHFLREACAFFIEEATRSEMDALAECVSWTEVQSVLKIDSLEIKDQMKKLVDNLQDILSSDARENLLGLSSEQIQKFANMTTTENTRHTLDKSLVLELPTMETRNYHTLFSIISETREIVLARIQSGATYSTNLLREIVNSLYSDLIKNRDLNQYGQIVAIAHICSWAFPICVAVQTAYEKENSVQTLLEREKDTLFEDFKTLCDGTCLDHLAATSFYFIIESSLKDSLQNRLCTTMFERLSKAGNEMFCSRPRFLQVVLEDICQKEKFENYVGYLCRHSSFIQSWILDFIARECCANSKSGIRVEDIALHEIAEVTQETVECLETAARMLKQDDGKDVSFNQWVNTFSVYFEETVKSSFNEEDIAEMAIYTVLSDYELFANECKTLVQTTMQTKLLEHANLPDTSCFETVKEWFQSLPKKLHVSLADGVQGCGNQCPFCKTLCDDTVKEHKFHCSNLHFPIGLGGWRIRSTQHLVCDTCTANVASDRGHYSCHCPGLSCGHETKPYKNYRIDYPDWDIKPISDYEATMYWKWVLSRFNADFARHYSCKTALIPWGRVTKEEALSSIGNNPF